MLAWNLLWKTAGNGSRTVAGERAPLKFAPYTKPIRGRWAVGLVVAIGAAVLEISVPQMFQFIVDELIRNATKTGI